MLERLNEHVAFFLLIMSIILVTPLLSERVRLPGIIVIILGEMLIGPLKKNCSRINLNPSFWKRKVLAVLWLCLGLDLVSALRIHWAIYPNASLHHLMGI
ncbi:MAG TPA: hypothetical protein VFQ23_23805 [Anaerolineales bacterium]|nr:hypothetical protein [Anaerolineales bacterium]